MQRLFIVAILFLNSLTSLADEELEQFCSKRAVGTVAELRHEHYPEMSTREIEIARKTAVLACIDARTSKQPLTSTNQEIDNTGEELESLQVIDSDANESESLLDRLLKSSDKEDVSPRMKAHRNGGK